MPYHFKLDVNPPLPSPWDQETWVKGDMINAVGFHRLDFIRLGKDKSGKRLYRFDILTSDQMKNVKKCVLMGLGLTPLTKHLY